MSEDHEALAKEQEREAAALQEQSEKLGGSIDDVKDEAERLRSDETIATPDPSVEDVEHRPGPGREGPTLPADQA